MLAFTLLMRNWRSGELKLLSSALVMAVAVLSGIAIFTDRLESTLLMQSNDLLGADAILVSSRPFDDKWIAAAKTQSIQQTQTLEFSSMVYAGDEMHLAAIKAVEQGYPLRGHLEVSQIPFTLNPQEIVVAQGVPNPGEVWVDSRLLPQLHSQIGDVLAVGERELKITQVLIREPGSSGSFAGIAPRVLMNKDDVASTQVTMEGSRVNYAVLFAHAESDRLTAFIAWLKPQLSKHERIETIATSQERLSETLKSGKNFLLFAAVIAVLLAGVAIAIAARQFADRHTNQVALMKSLGTSARQIRQLYFGQLFILGALASLLGLVFGYAIQWTIAASIQGIFQIQLVSGHVDPYALSFFSGLVCLTFFALPSLWFLPAIPPLKILRRELSVNGFHRGLQAVLAFFAVILLVGLFSRDVKMTLSVAVVLLIVSGFSSLFAFLFLVVSQYWVSQWGGFWRFALANLQRHKGQSLVQIMVFSVAILLLLTLSIVKTSLIDDWKQQLPVKAPNHFILNIAPAETTDVAAILSAHQPLESPLYPMVRGRLTQINGVDPSEDLIKKANALQREVNLTQATQVASDNKILEGQWWYQWNKTNLVGVSVEKDTAQQLQLHLGDTLRFSIGGLLLDAQVASIRSVEWKSMRPNFFFIFEPSALDAYSPTYMTSVYVAPDQKKLINQLLHKYPTITVMELDRVIEQMRTIIKQVADAIALVLWLTLLSGSLVLFAAVMSSIDSRKQEAGLLRALGSSKKLILGSVLLEFLLLGLVSGIVAVIGAEALLFAMQTFIFKQPIHPHYLYWLLAPLLSAIYIASLGVICCRPVVTTPPMVVLREAS